MMTFSEFGRRVSQNASGGTDHGTANNMFFISGGLKEKGMLNALPNLADLNEGDLKHTVDFKDVYATVLNKWLGANDKLILGKGSLFATGLVAGGAVAGVIIAFLSGSDGGDKFLREITLEHSLTEVLSTGGYFILGVLFFAAMGLMLYRTALKK